MRSKNWLLLFVACITLLLTPCQVQAQSNRAYDWPTVSGVGYTTTLNLLNVQNTGVNWVSTYQNFSVGLGSGSNSVCTYQVWNSDDQGTNWYTVGSAQSCTAVGNYQPGALPLRLIKIQVVTYTGTASLTFHWTGSGS